MLLNDLQRLIAYPTVSNRPIRSLASHLAERAEDCGFEVTSYESPHDPTKVNVVATIGPEDAGLKRSQNEPWHEGTGNSSHNIPRHICRRSPRGQKVW